MSIVESQICGECSNLKFVPNDDPIHVITQALSSAAKLGDAHVRCITLTIAKVPQGEQLLARIADIENSMSHRGGPLEIAACRRSFKILAYLKDRGFTMTDSILAAAFVENHWNIVDLPKMGFAVGAKVSELVAVGPMSCTLRRMCEANLEISPNAPVLAFARGNTEDAWYAAEHLKNKAPTPGDAELEGSGNGIVESKDSK